MYRRWMFATVAGLALTVAQSGWGEVSLKNGNFFTGAKDLVLPGGFEPQIERVYNSKTSFKGIFGNGWGSDYEMYLVAYGDGSVVVREYGGGAENRFDPPAMTQAQIEAAVERIAGVAQAQGDVTGEQNLADYRKRLLTDASFRSGEWEKYVQESLLKAAALPVGTKLTSERFSYEVVTVLKDGYRRDFDNGRVEFFRQDGKLRQIADKNGNYIAFSYDVPQQIGIRDNFGRTMVLTENDRGLVTHVDASNGQTADYRYNDYDELIYAKDSKGAVYQYEYDAGHRHNLTKMTYPDQTTMEIDYYPREQFEDVKSVKDRDGTLTEYAYDIDKNNSRHYTVSVKVLGSSDDGGKRKELSASTYEYVNKAKASGEEYTAEMITTIDGDRTDTQYNEDGNPTRIEAGGGVTTFAYDARQHVVLKVTQQEKTELSYDAVANKVTWVRITDLTTGKVTSQDWFSYDAAGNLLTAKSASETIRIKYDGNGRIEEMDSGSGKDIAFAYDNNSKPIKISVLAHKGEDGKPVPEQSITVTYTAAGEIEKVESPGGRQAALAVTAAFQDLLDMIRPAGVTLSF